MIESLVVPSPLALFITLGGWFLGRSLGLRWAMCCAAVGVLIVGAWWLWYSGDPALPEAATTTWTLRGAAVGSVAVLVAGFVGWRRRSTNVEVPNAEVRA